MLLVVVRVAGEVSVGRHIGLVLVGQVHLDPATVRQSGNAGRRVGAWEPSRVRDRLFSHLIRRVQWILGLSHAVSVSVHQDPRRSHRPPLMSALSSARRVELTSRLQCLGALDDLLPVGVVEGVEE